MIEDDWPEDEPLYIGIVQVPTPSGNLHRVVVRRGTDKNFVVLASSNERSAADTYVATVAPVLRATVDHIAVLRGC